VYLNDQPVTVDSEGHVLEAPYHQVFKQSLKVAIAPGDVTATLPYDPIAGTVSVQPTIASRTLGDGEAEEPPTFTVVGRVVTLSAAYNTGILYVNYQAYVDYYYAKVWWELGSATAAADARTKALFPELWTDNHRAQGVAKLVAEFTYNETAFPSGVPAITARIRGAKVYDPRTATTAWSENPALLARHVYTHPMFGKATPSADEETRFIAAANACDTSQLYFLTDGTSTPTQLYRAALVVPYGTPARSALDDLTQAMGGMYAFAGGELYLRAGVYTAPVLTLTDDDLAVIQRNGDSEQQDALSIRVHRERADKFNVVNARIWDSEQGYRPSTSQGLPCVMRATRWCLKHPGSSRPTRWKSSTRCR
jgi:hypothetical protein